MSLIEKCYLVKFNDINLSLNYSDDKDPVNITGYFKTIDIETIMETFKNVEPDKVTEAYNNINIASYIQDIIGLYTTDKNIEPVKYVIEVNYDTHTFDAKNEILHCKVINNITKYINHILSERGVTPDKRIITIWNYASTKEFPEDQYYDPNNFDKDENIENKSPLDIQAILDRNAKALNHNYISINSLCNLQTSEPFILKDEQGTKFYEYIQNLK